MKTFLISLAVIAIAIGLYYLVKYLMNKYGKDTRVIDTNRDTIVKETIVSPAPIQTFSTGGPNMIITPSAGGLGVGGNMGAGARVVGGNNH